MTLSEQVLRRLPEMAGVGRFWYHGTAKAVLPAILKQGLVPRPSRRVSDEDGKEDQADRFKPFEGVYFTSLVFPALERSMKANDVLGHPSDPCLLVVASLNLFGTHPDEDDLPRPKDVLRGVTSAWREASGERLGDDEDLLFQRLEQALKDGVERYLQELDKRVTGALKPETAEAVRPWIRKLLNVGIEEILDGDWEIGYDSHSPSYAYVQEIVNLLRGAHATHDRVWNARVPGRVGFQDDDNRIVAVIEVPRWERDQKSLSIRVHYGNLKGPWIRQVVTDIKKHLGLKAALGLGGVA